MDGNRNLSLAGYADMRAGALAGSDFSFFKQQAGFQGGSTSRISAGSSLQNFTRWANDIGSGGTPNAALLGKGQVDFGSSQQTIPPISTGA